MDLPDTKYPAHRCGAVQDYCIYEDTTIYFCLFCKKVTGATKKPNIRITINLTDKPMKEYDQSLLEELK